MLGQKEEGGGIVMDKPKIVVHGPTQFGNNNVQNNTLNVNTPDAYSSDSEVLHGRWHAPHVRPFRRDERLWDASVRSSFEIKLTAPYQKYEIKGFPLGRFNVQIGDDPEQGSLTYSTTTPLTERVVEFHFIGERPMDVVRVGVSPWR